MRFWNGVVMYAPRAPEYYALPATELCIFRLMQLHGDAQAWNLYWVSRPQTDQIPLHRKDWHRFYNSLSIEETKAFYDSLDTVVYNQLSLATVLAQPPREAMRLIALAHLERTRLYPLLGGEQWRNTMLGRLFLAERIGTGRTGKDRGGEVVLVDFASHGRSRAHPGRPTKRPA